MARNKEALLLLLDVGPTMHTALPEVEKVCSMLLGKKLIYNKYDEVGVILFGTEETENELTKQVGGYENVSVLRNVKVVDGDLVDVVQQLPRGTAAGDFLDAIVVGMDMLIKKYGPTTKGKKRICLITSALGHLKEPSEGTKVDQVNVIASQMTVYGMKLECIVLRGKLSNGGNKKVMDENDHLLDVFSKNTWASTVYVESATSFLGAIRTRNIAPVTIFRGDLELSSRVKIKVWVYKKTSEEKFPTLKKYSDKAPPSDKFATHEVKVDYEYKSVEDTSRVVPPEERIKGYRYGPHVIPISSAELEAVKFTTEKGVKLLGFTDSSNVPRFYYMKDVNIFIAEPGNKGATLAVSALARAMRETNKVAIIRSVWRQGQTGVVIGVLTPNVSDKQNVPDSFYFNVLPFNEDVREFHFPSFRNLPPTWQPTEQQQEVADNLVKMLDLAPPGKEEMLQPDLTPNPVLERFYRFLELKSKHQDAAVPPLDETLERITKPDPDLCYQKKSVIDEFVKHFEVKENPKMKKSVKRLPREKPSGSDEEKEDIKDDRHVNRPKTESLETSPVVKVEKLGDLTPVQDFEAMLSRRDNPDWVSKAIKGMKRKIHDLLEDSYEGDNYNKALECLAALRKGCILEQEPKEFNDFLQYISNYCRTNGLASFCDLLASKGITFVTKTEAADSEVTEDEAKSYLLANRPKVEKESS